MTTQSSDHPVRLKIVEITVDYSGGIFFRAGLLGSGVKAMPQIFQFFRHMCEQILYPSG